VTAEGTYHQLGAFLARVAELPRVVIVSALKMTAVDRPAATLRAEMTLTTYVYRPAGAPAAPGLAGAKPPVSAPIAGETAPRETASQAPTPSSSMTIALESPGALAQGALASNAMPDLAPHGPRHPASARSVPTYASRGRRDPFDPAGFPAPQSANAIAVPRTSFGAATLTGIVRGPDGLLALVETSDGLGHILRAGDGIEGARVIRVGPDSVVFWLPPVASRAGQQVVLALGGPK